MVQSSDLLMPSLPKVESLYYSQDKEKIGCIKHSVQLLAYGKYLVVNSYCYYLTDSRSLRGLLVFFVFSGPQLPNFVLENPSHQLSGFLSPPPYSGFQIPPFTHCFIQILSFSMCVMIWKGLGRRQPKARSLLGPLDLLSNRFMGKSLLRNFSKFSKVGTPSHIRTSTQQIIQMTCNVSGPFSHLLLIPGVNHRS